MTARWEPYLERWTKAGLLDASLAERVRAYEARQDRAQGLRWPVLLAIAFGGLLLGAGVLLFVAAHWDTLAPSARFGLVVLLVAIFHVAAAFLADGFPALSTTLHAVGTICLGAGIFLAGQIFNLEEHWPAGLMLWALGASLAWALLRDWPQAALVAVLTPMWLSGEWIEATGGDVVTDQILAEGLLLLSISYLTALLPEKETTTRKALGWIGGLTVICFAAAVPLFASSKFSQNFALPPSYHALGSAAAFALPLAVAWWLRGSAAWMNVIAALWVAVLSATTTQSFGAHRNLSMYALWALGSIGLVAWGLMEARRERINLGVAGFALTVLFFYFSNVMDKLGRSASLIGLGLLFLLGGWLLEQTRRRLVAQLEKTKA
jgi:uncharacterized membrane protein